MTFDRRRFLALSLSSSAAAAAAPSTGDSLPSPSILGKLQKEDGPSPMGGANWFVAQAPGDGLSYRFPAGFLTRYHSMTADFLLDGRHMMVFSIVLQEGDGGRRFRLSFAGLNQCSFRMRMALALTDQNRWLVEREGAFLKPLVGGDRVDLAKVDRLSFTLTRKADGPARFAMTPMTASPVEVEKLVKPLLPKGPLIDELGQYTLHDWPGKSRSAAEVTARIRKQYQSAPKQTWPETFSRWGGWKARRLDSKGSGFFQVKKEGDRFWLVDPDGYAFWSSGPDCVRMDCQGRYDGIEEALAWRPDPKGEYAAIYTSETRGGGARYANYLAANFIRTFGPAKWREHWSATALGELKRLRFNTVGNWSEWEWAQKAKFPYVRPMSFRGRRVPFIYRDFPDVFAAGFEEDAATYASDLTSSANDPAFIGYFLMNEPTWGFSSELPAAGMLYTNEGCATRDELVRHLKTRYSSDAALAAAWKMGVTFEALGRGRFRGVLTKEANDDLRGFTVKMVERYFQVLSKACRKADPNHLNLGMRWAGIPPEWAVEGMKTFDVFSLNCYMDKLPIERARRIHEMLRMPVLVGEWHFGALDVGLPASGIGHLRNQAERAKAYRIYLEDAAANPYCVGAHWFTLYDQSALGRFDGENYNIGFLDICHRSYDEMSSAAIASHERMYDVAAGRVKAFDAPVEYLPKLFL